MNSHNLIHLYVEVLKCSRVSPQQIRGVLWEEADTEKTLHSLEVSPMNYLKIENKIKKLIHNTSQIHQIHQIHSYIQAFTVLK